MRSDYYTCILEHVNNLHSSEVFKYRQLELDDRTGKFGYRTKILEQKSLTRDISDDTLELSQKDLNVLNMNITAEERASADESSVNVQDDLHGESDDLDEIISLMPDVIKSLKEHGQIEQYKKWCNLVASELFTMENIAYLSPNNFTNGYLLVWLTSPYLIRYMLCMSPFNTRIATSPYFNISMNFKRYP